MYLKQPCPICKNKNIRKCPAIKRWVNLIVAIIFWPAWIITIIITYVDYKYKCDCCKNVYKKSMFEKK